jgi:hypothetical protein
MHECEQCCLHSLQTTCSAHCRAKEQVKKVANFLQPVDDAVLAAIDQQAPPLKTLLNTAGSLPGSQGAVDVLCYHPSLADEEFLAVVQSDLKWAVLSFVSVFLYIAYHTRSFMVAAVGMFISGAPHVIRAATRHH